MVGKVKTSVCRKSAVTEQLDVTRELRENTTSEKITNYMTTGLDIAKKTEALVSLCVRKVNVSEITWVS